MNRYAYRTTGLAIKTISNLSKARIKIHDQENIPEGSIVFVINHFTRIETLFLPYYINQLINIPVWSLADYGLFKGGLAGFLDKVGAVSTKNPDRDLLIVKSLLTGEAAWIIFPEGRMVKSKKIYEKRRKKGRFVVASSEGSHRPHTGAATLALRTQFYRERIRMMREKSPEEAKRLMDLYQIESYDAISGKDTYVVPVNITYYPIRAKQNLLSTLAVKLLDDLSERTIEEIMTEGTMLLSGVDVDIRFGEPIKTSQYMKSASITKDIATTAPINFDDPISSKRMMRMSSLNIMKRYMSSIYNMTTVNHDHLFASILKYIPLNKIGEQDFKRRIYYATALQLEKTAHYYHKNFNENQINLLTDDRYKRFENFISVAVEKEIVERKDDVLIKDASFSESPDFHRARIDNPIAVIANEVEPLTNLQDQLRRIAFHPALRIKYWITQFLLEKALFDFEKDYTNFYIEGESKEKDAGRPFLLKGKNKDTGIILIHGYMAAPLEVRELANYLWEMGYTVYAPRLKGHGTSPDDLETRSYMEWVESVEEGYILLKNMCRHVVAGGFSTGAGLALDLASRVKRMDGVFAVSPPLKLQDFSTRFVPAVNLWNWLMGKVNFEAAKKEFVENEPENPHINYFRNPLSGVRELDRLMNSISPKLNSVTIPALVIQSYRDPVVNPNGSRKVFELLGTEKKEYLLLNMDRHGILLGDGSERVYKAISDFIKSLS